MVRIAESRCRADEVMSPTPPRVTSTGLEDLPDWEATWFGCMRRFRSWKVPPRWSAGDWAEEVRAQGLAAAWQALCDFDPSRGVPRGAFVRQRVLAGVLTRYRQEWSYALRVGNDRPDPSEPLGEAAATPPSPADVVEALRGPLSRLAESERWLIERLYWHGKTESDVAAELGISQPAVNKRKRAIIHNLRREIGSWDEVLEGNRL